MQAARNVQFRPSGCSVGLRPTGFTLVEMLVVFSVVGVLLSVALPAFQAFFATQRLASVADTVASDVRRARTEAIIRGPGDFLRMEFTTSPSSWSYQLVDSAGSVLLTRSSANAYSDEITMTISAGSFGDDDIDGNPDFRLLAFRGLTGDAAGDIVLQNDNGESITIARNLLGRVDLCSSSVSGYAAC